MKSIANQYRDLKEGKLSQANFMRNLRMTMPQYVTNTTSFTDAVKILKSKRILNESKDGDDDAETLAMIDKIAKEKEGEEAVMAQYDESLNEAKKEKVDADRVHPNELSMGIRVEMEHTDDPEKAKKIALDHLAENPFYYTELKLSGVDTKKTTPTKEKKAIAKKKDETELVDKANQMKPVKGVEKAKASANKANKETNKPVKGISLMSLIAKTSKGVQKMAATGEKMKVVKEGYEEFVAQKKSEEAEAAKIKQATNADNITFNINDKATTPEGDEITIKGFMVDKDGKTKAIYMAKTGMYADAIDVDGLTKKKDIRPGVNLGKYNLKDLTELVQEVLAEMESDDEVNTDTMLGLGETFDGRDNVTDVAGHQLDETDGSQEIEKKINTGEIDPAKVKTAAEKAMKGDSTDLALLMAFGK